MLHVVSIVGAIALAVTVGLLISIIESAMQGLMITTEQHHRLADLHTEAENLDGSIVNLHSETAAAALLAVGQTTDRWLVELVKLRQASDHISVTSFDSTIQPLQHMIQSCRDITLGGGSEGDISAAVAQLQLNSDQYTNSVEQLANSASFAVEASSTSLTRKRRVGILAIGVLCLLYLAMIEHTRYWTTRRLVRPVEQLADAAIQAMRGEESLPQLEACGTQELNALARMLSTFVETLKQKVHERTAELERQELNLEREVTVRRRAEEQLRHAAFHDRLTNLCNRDLLMDRLDRCVTRARRNADYKFAVLFLDIDRFKEVNDSLGHFVGDQLLVAIAERLQICLRSSDSLSRVESNTVARIGGDEFVVLLDGITERADASVVAQRVQDSLAKPFSLQGQEVFTTASIGIAFNELECEKADYLLRDADTAMYYAKAAGKARHEVFNTKMHDEARSRLQLHNDLRRAIENAEFKVFYQPIISLSTGRLTSFEALARWHHPSRGLVDPVDFISHAEETGLIVLLGHWMLEQACSQLKEWRDGGVVDPAVSVNVNVSKRQVAQAGYVDGVGRILREVGLPGSLLNLEITETVIMENPDSIAEVLRQIKDLGILVHMDDFGTGYSSLSYLHRFPLDVLKIDRAFVSTMSQDNDYADIIHTVVSLAHTLNMKVTVEGVETMKQLNQLMALKCDFAQGFYFAEPTPAAEAGKLAASRTIWLKDAA